MFRAQIMCICIYSSMLSVVCISKKLFFYEIDTSCSKDKCDFETSSGDESSDDDLLAERM